jgi:hypothetical protein
VTEISAYGSGWTRNRYQLSSCDSIPQPDSPTPAIMSWKLCSSVAMSVMGVAPEPGVSPSLAATDGNHSRNPDGCAAASAGPDPVRSTRRPWSSSGDADGQTSPPLPPSDDVTMPMCRSCTGLNSTLPCTQLPSASLGPYTVEGLVGSTQLGETRRARRSGMAAFR